MTRVALSAALVLALSACGQQDAPERTNLPAATDETRQEIIAEAVADADADASPHTGLDGVLQGQWRTPAFVERDRFRNPKQTLEFFGIRPDMRVVEITPGGGWYAEILAPYLRDSGQWIGAVVDPQSATTENAQAYYLRTNNELRDKLDAAPEQFDDAQLVEFDAAAPRFGDPGTADMVLTFRNVHNWMGSGNAQAMFNGFFEVLKTGGVLGVVEHRAAADVPEGDRSGYVSEAQVIAYAEGAGFVLEDRSDINANPADTRDHPNGVWTLPPSLRVPEGEDAEKYRAIGESDRMTLRFRKPTQ
jgi:predicted methyltransferase